MKWSQHRLNANKHLIRFRTVDWALCTTDRLCAVYDRSHWLAVAAADVCMRALFCICFAVCCAFRLHHIRIGSALAWFWVESIHFGIYCIQWVSIHNSCTFEWRMCAWIRLRVCCWYILFMCVSRRCFYMCSMCCYSFVLHTRSLSHWYPHTNLATDFIVSSCAYVLIISCHHNHTQKSCFYGPTLTPASHCVYKVPIAHLTHDDAKASTVYICICFVWL